MQGHIDVVPPGDPDRWAGDPFEPRIERRRGRHVLVGRGACDMKAGVVAVLAAVAAVYAARSAGVAAR